MTRSSDPPQSVPPLPDALTLFRCPECRGELLLEGERLVSPECGASYAVHGGIPLFVETDEFYEGKFVVPTQDGVAARSGAARRVKAFYDRFSSTTVKHQFTRSFLERIGAGPGTQVLDVGCGGGNEIYAPLRTVGVDLSFEGLEAAAGIYRAVATADSRRLPFADGTFDLVSTWDVFGHIPAEMKDEVLAEWRRVLKPGGWMLHIIEAHCTAPFYRLVREDEELFRKCFIDLDGHYGLELPHEIFARFRRAGFEPVNEWSFFRAGIFPPEEYAKRLGPEYASRSRLLSSFAAFGRACSSSRPLDRVMSFVTGVAARAANPLLPADWGSTVFLTARKPR